MPLRAYRQESRLLPAQYNGFLSALGTALRRRGDSPRFRFPLFVPGSSAEGKFSNKDLATDLVGYERSPSSSSLVLFSFLAPALNSTVATTYRRPRRYKPLNESEADRARALSAVYARKRSGRVRGARPGCLAPFLCLLFSPALPPWGRWVWSTHVGPIGLAFLPVHATSRLSARTPLRPFVRRDCGTMK